MSLVYAFDHAHEGAPTELRHLLGGKGADLAEMTSVLGLPVPPGFTITTEACRAYLSIGAWPSGLADEIAEHLDRLETKFGRQLGSPSDPLLVSVRSGAALSMPGMMDTVLNLGLNDDSVEGLAKQTGDQRFAYDSYRRFIAMFARIVLGLDARRFDELLDAARNLAGVSSDAEIPAELLRYLTNTSQRLVAAATGRPFPQDPAEQVRLADRRGVHVVDRHPGGRVPQSRAHSARSRDRGERAGDGIREP